jgi:hypothetical protein
MNTVVHGVSFDRIWILHLNGTLCCRFSRLSLLTIVK